MAAGVVTVWNVLRYMEARREENGIYPTCSCRTPLSLRPESNSDLDSLRPRVSLLSLGEYRLLQAQVAAGNPARPTILHQG